MIPEIKIFHPTMDEFKNFNQYLGYMESREAHLAGVAKVVPPRQWIPRQRRCDTKDVMDLNIPHPICQVAEGKLGLYQLCNCPKRQMTVLNFKDMALSEKYHLGDDLTFDQIERKYWRNITYTPPIYGADVPGFISDKTLKIWNMNKLGTVLDYTMEDYGVTITGVNTPYLYFGMWKSSFAWHTEDMDLYSINYLHDGSPKTWYAIPPKHGFRFERLAKGFFPAEANSCPAFLRHKTTIIAPHMLKKYSIPFNKITQEKGEIMITFPFGYHAGFNHGFNIAESTNFASPRWVEYGKRAVQCHCRSDTVRINMDTFVKRIQPEKYHDWLHGKDIGCHPEDPKRLYAAPPPTVLSSDEDDSDSSPKQSNKARRQLAAYTPKCSKSKKKIASTASDVSKDSYDSDQNVEVELDEEQREVMEDVWLKANEMDLSEASYNVGKSRTFESTSDTDYSCSSNKRNKKKRTTKRKSRSSKPKENVKKPAKS